MNPNVPDGGADPAIDLIDGPVDRAIREITLYVTRYSKVKLTADKMANLIRTVFNHCPGIEPGLVVGHFTQQEDLPLYLANFQNYEIAEHLFLLADLSEDRLAVASIRPIEEEADDGHDRAVNIVMVGRDGRGVGERLLGYLKEMELDIKTVRAFTYRSADKFFVLVARVRNVKASLDNLKAELRKRLGRSVRVKSAGRTQAVEPSFALVDAFKDKFAGADEPGLIEAADQSPSVEHRKATVDPRKDYSNYRETLVAFERGPDYSRRGPDGEASAFCDFIGRWSRGHEELLGQFRSVQGKLDSLIRQRPEAGGHPDPAADAVTGLSPKARQILESVGRIAGTDDRARSRAEELIAGLEGERSTEALTTALKRLLKDRGWGVNCSCGAPATVLWQRNQAYIEGGHMRFSHTSDGRSVTHGGHATIPTLTLVDRPDRRRQPDRDRRRAARRAKLVPTS